METCRTCAKCDFEDEQNWLDLFHPTRWIQEVEHIRVEFSNWKLEISQNDGLPQKICTDCFTKFCTVYTFRLACQDAQLKLNNIFDKIEDDSQIMETTNTVSLSMEEANSPSKCKTKNVETKYLQRELFEMETETALAFNIRRGTAMEDANTQTDLLMLVSSTTVPKNTAVKLNNCSVENKEPPPKRTTTEIDALHSEDAVAVRNNDDLIEEEHEEEDDEEEEDEEEPEEVLEKDIVQKEDAELLDLVDGVIEAFQPLSSAEIDINFLTETADETEAENDCDLETNAREINFTFECKYCYKNKDTLTSVHFVTQDGLLSHITACHDQDNPFDCPHCERRFQDAASRTVHIKDQHVAKHYNCNVCGKRYADRFNLRHHIEKYHSDTDFECELCEKRFYSRKSLNYHMKWHNPERQFKCAYCDRLFINQRHLKCHEATHTGIRSFEYCSFCGKAFIHLKTLRWHIYRQHGGEKPVKCGSCTAVFASYLDKRIHMLEHHLENLTSIEKTECVRCHKRYENETDLKEHMTEHQQNADKPKLVIANNKRVLQSKQQKRYSGIFQCESCSASFNMKSALERHAAMHSTAGRPHACPQCPKRFKRVQDMNWHLKTHSNEKANVCDVCGKGFALKYVLTQHRRSHEVLEKNFTCATCGKSYLFEKSLKIHERQHTGKTYYKCDLCGENFVTHIKFKCHMRKIHDPTEAGTKDLPLATL